MVSLRAYARFALAFSCVLAGLCAAGITAAPSLRKHRPQLTLLWFRGFLRALHVTLIEEGEEAAAGCLQVANHVSWLDILVLGAAGTPRFVAKAEIRQWPMIGRLAAVVDTIFLPRGAYKSSQTAERVATYLARGESVLVFPEATTTDGKRTRHFHARFFAASIISGKSVQPIALQYHVPGGEYQAVPYVDNTSLAGSLFALLRQPQIEARVIRQPLIQTADQDRKALAQAARISIDAVLAQREMAALVSTENFSPATKPY